MAYVYQTNKQTGITYVYDNVPYWDKEKKQSRAKRKLITKLDPLIRENMPTRSYKKKELAIEPAAAKPGLHPITKTLHYFYDATYLLDQIGCLTGIEADLKQLFRTDYKQILSIAYFLILEEQSTLSRFPHCIAAETW